METHDYTRLAIGVGVFALFAAWVGVLFRQTRGVPPRRRVVLMLRYTLLAVWSILPPRWFLAAASAGTYVFLSVFFTCMTVVVLVIRMIPLDAPHATEAYESMGDAYKNFCILTGGAALSFWIALVAGSIAGQWRASRWHKSDVFPPSDSE